jgi:hypothetical protein
MDTKQVKKIAGKEVKAHEKKMHGTKGMAKGGVTTEQMKSLGRNMARAANQKTG